MEISARIILRVLRRNRAFDNPRFRRIVDCSPVTMGEASTMSRICAIAFALATTSVLAAAPVHADGPPPARRSYPADAYALHATAGAALLQLVGRLLGGHIGGGWGNDQATLTTVGGETQSAQQRLCGRRPRRATCTSSASSCSAPR